MNELITAESTGHKMSSLEIAEMMNKQHAHVMRDIRLLIEQGAINESNFGFVDYKDAKGEMRAMCLLDFDGTMILITGYDAKRRSIVIKRWRELETGIATPTYQIPKDKPKTLLPIDKEFRAAVRMAKAAGLKGNAAIISANNLTRRMTGSDCLLLLEATHIINEKQEQYFTVTEIGLMGNIGSGQFVNKLLAKLGFQERVGKKWAVTPLGMEFAIILDTGKKHGDGTMVQQLKWKEGVLLALSNAEAA